MRGTRRAAAATRLCNRRGSFDGDRSDLSHRADSDHAAGPAGGAALRRLVGLQNIIQPVPARRRRRVSSQSVSKGQLKAGQVTIKVYNGGDRKGLAGDVGRALRDKGFKVSLTDNTVEKIQQDGDRRRRRQDPEVLFVKTFFKDAVVRADKRTRPLGRCARRQQVRRLQQERQDHVRGEDPDRLPAVRRSQTTAPRDWPAARAGAAHSRGLTCVGVRRGYADASGPAGRRGQGPQAAPRCARAGTPA